MSAGPEHWQLRWLFAGACALCLLWPDSAVLAADAAQFATVPADALETDVVPDALTLRRALVAFISLIGGFALCLAGWELLDRRRRWRGSALIVCGGLLGLGAVALLRLTELHQTWNWWI